jgi:nucleotide-binding universal stress UspA family protein
VGVNGSPASRAALQWAADEAERNGCRLRIVLIWQSEHRASYAQRPDHRDRAERHDQACCILSDTVGAVLGSSPWRSTSVETVEGQPEHVLVAASEDADLLVLGSGPASVIGPVLRTCLTKALCPVVVVSRQARPKSVPQPESAPASRRAVVAASR